MRHLIVILLVACPLLLAAQSAPHSDALSQQQKLNQVVRYLNGLYVDDVDMKPLVEGAIKGMLSELDPHSAYISAEEMKGVQESFNGEFSGIGVEFSILKDTVIVVNTIVGGPAERVGVLPNDRIVRVDTVNAVGFKQLDVPKYLRGKTGSKVEIDVVRHGEPGLLHFMIVRDKIPLNTIDAAYRVDGDNGYIKVNRFGRTTMREFREAFASLGSTKGLILDLRGNGGGLMDQAIDMANFFLPQNATIVSTEGRVIPSTSFEARRNGEFTTGKLVILIDENSASASEIVAGAIQDWDRGVIVGRPSFGKGLVQRQMMLDDGSAVRITVARYHTPSGRVIQRPYQKGESQAYYQDHYKRMDARMRDSMNAGAPAYQTLRTHRTVYGGGGITPDLLVDVDTTGMTTYLMNLIRRGVVNEFALAHLDEHRKELAAAYPTFENYNSQFTVSDTLLEKMTQLGEKRGVPLDPKEFEASKQFMKHQLKALFGQKLFTLEAFYRVMNQTENPMFSRAVSLLNNWEEEGLKILEPKK